MLRGVYKALVNVAEQYEGICAVIAVVLSLVLGLSLAFGTYLFCGWIVMLVYNIAANAFDWPTFSIWFWTGVVFILGLARTVVVKNEE